MPNDEDKYDTQLAMQGDFFNSFKLPEVRLPVKTTCRTKPYQEPNVPFDLFHKPDPITRGDPRIKQEPYERIKDEDRAKVQKSRPKVIGNGPAFDLDAAEEPCRQIVIDDMYTTTTMKAQRDAVMKDQLNVRAPLPNAYTKSRPILIEPVTLPYVSPEWRKDTVNWDDRQLRGPVASTKIFWLTREKPFCSVCEDSAMRTAMNKTRN